MPSYESVHLAYTTFSQTTRTVFITESLLEKKNNKSPPLSKRCFHPWWLMLEWYTNIAHSTSEWLTPPTRSKWSPSRSKSTSCPLNAQEKDTSRAGSWAIWQGSTMLSPTMISMLLGPRVILVGSVQRVKTFWHHRPASLYITQHTLTSTPVFHQLF